MESCNSLDALTTHFEVKLASLTTSMDLVAIALEPYGVKSECRDHLNRIEKDLLDAEDAVGQVKDWVQVQKDQLKSAQALHEDLKSLNEHLRYIEGHLPERLPVHQNQVINQSQRKPSSSEDNTGPLQPIPVSENQNKKSSKGSKQPKPKPSPAPTMEYLTVTEFESIPKYMKGRLTYGGVNVIVDAFNDSTANKYKLMKRPRSGLNDRDLKRYHKYKEQENKDTKGQYFVTEDDLKKYGSLKVDAAARSMLTILRHCGRTREIRGGGLTRYVVIP